VLGEDEDDAFPVWLEEDKLELDELLREDPEEVDRLRVDVDMM